MDFQEFITEAKRRIFAYDSTATEENIENFWMGNVMEIRKVLFRRKDANILYLVTANTMTEEYGVIKYIPEQVG